MQEGDAAESRAAGCGGVARHTCRSAQRPLDLVKKDLREGSDGSGSVGQHAPQSLRHGDHPLSHGHRRNDVIGEVCGGLCHVAAVAGRTHTAALCRRRPRRSPCGTSCRQRGRIRSRAVRTRDSRGVPPRRGPARAARPLLARRASARGSRRRPCGAASSRADAARNGGTPRGLRAGGGGFARETL